MNPTLFQPGAVQWPLRDACLSPAPRAQLCKLQLPKGQAQQTGQELNGSWRLSLILPRGDPSWSGEGKASPAVDPERTPLHPPAPFARNEFTATHSSSSPLASQQHGVLLGWFAFAGCLRPTVPSPCPSAVLVWAPGAQYHFQRTHVCFSARLLTRMEQAGKRDRQCDAHMGPADQDTGWQG